MATRFYISNTSGLVCSFTQDAGWEDFDPTTATSQGGTAIYNVYLDVNKRGTLFATYTNNRRTSGIVAGDDNLIVRMISKPLDTQTISGTFKGQMLALESAATLDARAQLIAKVIAPNGTVRGTLYAMDTSALSNEWATVATNRKFPLAWAGAGATLTNVNAIAGDVLVIEVGARTHAATTGGSVTIRLGDSAASFLPEDETTTTELNPWIEFSQDLIFLAEDDMQRRQGGKFVQLGGTSRIRTVHPNNYGVIEGQESQVSDVNHASDLCVHAQPQTIQLGPYTHTTRPFKSYYANRNHPTTFAPYETQRRPSFLIEDGEVPPDLGGGLTRYYYMTWRDADSVSPIFRVWTVTGQPDPNGVSYIGPKSGVTPITNAFVAAEWFE